MNEQPKEKTAWQTLNSREQLLILMVWVAIAATVVNFLGGGDWLQIFNFFLGLIGGATTSLWIESLLKQRDKEARKAQLIREMRSKDNGIAQNAVEELRALDGLYDDSLVGVSLWEANLEGVELDKVNLQGANLGSANLQGARLVKANLRNAVLGGANLRGANLRSADLQDAVLIGSIQKRASGGFTVLKADTMFNERTVLPDGSNWKASEDMSRFTDPNHPQFWQPEWAKQLD